MKTIKLTIEEETKIINNAKNIVERTSNTSDVLFMSISVEEDPDHPFDLLGLKSFLESADAVDIEITYEDGNTKLISREVNEVNVVRMFDFPGATEIRITF